MKTEKQLRQYVKKAKYIRVTVIATKHDTFFFSITKSEAIKWIDKMFSGTFHFIEIKDINFSFDQETKCLWIG